MRIDEELLTASRIDNGYAQFPADADHVIDTENLEGLHNQERVPPKSDQLPDKEVIQCAGDLLRALAAPARISIVLRLRSAPHCVHELVESLSLPQPLISQHLRVLREQRIVAVERSGREAMYRLADHHLAEIVAAAISHAEEG